jgi:ammonium transporter, Amt family
VAGFSYSFVMTVSNSRRLSFQSTVLIYSIQTIILWVMHFIPGLTLRTTEEAEILGVDDADMGEFAYDYVGIDQEIGHTLDTGLTAAGGGREPDHGKVSNSSIEEKSSTPPPPQT